MCFAGSIEAPQFGFYPALGSIGLLLTSLGKELRVYNFEGVFTHHARGTLCFETSVQALQLGLGETRSAPESRN